MRKEIYEKQHGNRKAVGANAANKAIGNDANASLAGESTTGMAKAVRQSSRPFRRDARLACPGVSRA